MFLAQLLQECPECLGHPPDAEHPLGPHQLSGGVQPQAYMARCYLHRWTSQGVLSLFCFSQSSKVNNLSHRDEGQASLTKER